MPKQNGTGPKGKGPMSGRGSGYCAILLNTTDQEMGFLKDQEHSLKKELRHVRTRIKRVEGEAARQEATR